MAFVRTATAMAAALAIVAVPAAASAKGARASAASSLSLAHTPAFSLVHVRAGAKRGKESKAIFGAGGLFGFFGPSVAAQIAAATVIVGGTLVTVEATGIADLGLGINSNNNPTPVS
jgi:hypothetical protein